MVQYTHSSLLQSVPVCSIRHCAAGRKRSRHGLASRGRRAAQHRSTVPCPWSHSSLAWWSIGAGSVALHCIGAPCARRSLMASVWPNAAAHQTSVRVRASSHVQFASCGEGRAKWWRCTGDAGGSFAARVAPIRQRAGLHDRTVSTPNRTHGCPHSLPSPRLRGALCIATDCWSPVDAACGRGRAGPREADAAARCGRAWWRGSVARPARAIPLSRSHLANPTWPIPLGRSHLADPTWPIPLGRSHLADPT